MGRKKKPPAAPAPAPTPDDSSGVCILVAMEFLAAAEKLTNKNAKLWSLNTRLIEGTAELREELFCFSIEHDVALIVLTSHLADERLCLDRRAAALRSTRGLLGSVTAETDEMKKALNRAVSVLDLKAKEVIDLESKIQKTERDCGDLEGIKRDEMESMEDELGKWRNELDSVRKEKEEAEKRLKAELVQMLGDLNVKMGTEIEQERAAETEEELQPFATELKTITTAFMSSEGKIKNLSDEVGMLKPTVAEAQNMIGRLLGLLLLATAVLCLAACAANIG